MNQSKHHWDESRTVPARTDRFAQGPQRIPFNRRRPARRGLAWIPMVLGLIGGAASCGVGGEGGDAPAAAAPANVVVTANGPVRGVADGDLRTFRGIPYAAPPVGDLRWQPPQPHPSWSAVRDAVEFGTPCWQNRIDGFYDRGDIPRSEDCLHLNVWTRSNPGDNAPVMVWIHGGALQIGHGHLDVYDGAALTEQGVVLVSINYRLGALGFFAHEALTEESAHKASGNQGIQDQTAALQWVQANIAAFGGDPNNVTIFGESAGSWSVCYQVATPLAKGLFHRAIGQSGGCFAPHPHLDPGWNHAAVGAFRPRRRRRTRRTARHPGLGRAAGHPRRNHLCDDRRSAMGPRHFGECGRAHFPCADVGHLRHRRPQPSADDDRLKRR